MFDNPVLYKVEDGLPQSFVSGIRQDADGFIWIGTLGGIARYDGQHFLSFAPNQADPGSISSGVVVSMQKGPGENFFMEYENRVYDVFDPLTHEVVMEKEMAWARSQDLYPILVDSKARWWMRTNDWRQVLVDPKKRTQLLFEEVKGNIPERASGTVVEGLDKKVYVFSKNGVSRFHDDRQKFELFARNPDPTHVATGFTYLLPDGRFVSESNRGLILFNPSTRRFDQINLPELLKGNLRNMQVAPDGMLYLEGDGRIYRWLKNGEFQLLWQIKGDTSIERTIPAFLVDNTGVLWIGTNAKGLYKINLRSLPLHALPYKVNFHTDILNQLSGFEKLVPASWANEKWSYFFRYHYTAKGALICSFGREPDKPLQVMIYENAKWQMLPAPSGNRHGIGGITSIGDTIYAIDVSGGLWKWSDTDRQPEFSQLRADMDVVSVVGLVTDQKSLLVLTERDGLYKFRDGQFIKSYHVTNLKESTIPFVVNYFSGIIQDPTAKNGFWLSTLGQGIIGWDIEKGFIKSISEKDGLPSATVYSIVSDQQKRLWIGTNKGLAVIYPANAKIYTFLKSDGLPGNEFNRFHVFHFSDGRLAFGGLEGSVTFDPKQFNADHSNPKTALTSLFINSIPQEFGKSTVLDKPLNRIEKLELPYDRNYLSISFAGVSFGNPEMLTYRYKLDGYDKNWNYVGKATTANYTGLPPGNYTFIVNAANTSGEWSRFDKRLTVQITPPFWATWWAYVIYVIVLMGAIRIYWRFRENQWRLNQDMIAGREKAKNLQELDAVKTRFFDNMTHELRTPLTLILTPLGKLIDQHDLSEPNRKNVQYAWENAGHLLGTVNQMLDISKIGSGTMHVHHAIGNLTEYVSQCVHPFLQEAARKGISVNEDIQLEETLYNFDADKWGKIIYNLLGNAIKFTQEGGRVDASLHFSDVEERSVEAVLTVKDTGDGITMDALPHIFERFYMANDSATRTQSGTGIGLSLVRELVTLMNGRIEVKSEPGNGSEFKVSIPVGKLEENFTAVSKPFNGHTDLLSVDLPDSSLGSSGLNIHNEAPLLLIVEDNEELRQFLEEGLRENWRVLSAANGLLALDLILDEIPDMIISDVMMPGMDGYELCRKVKADGRVSHIPVMLLTAKAAQDSRMQGLSDGADDYLTKPFHFNELVQIISTRLLQRERLKKHLQQQILPNEPPQKVTRTHDEFINNLYAQLDLLITESEVSVDALAGAVNMGRRTFTRKLKTLLDITPNELIRRYRLQKAAILLGAGEPAAQVAYKVGFESPSYFSQCFKDQYKVTPTEFAHQNE